MEHGTGEELRFFYSSAINNRMIQIPQQVTFHLSDQSEIHQTVCNDTLNVPRPWYIFLDLVHGTLAIGNRFILIFHSDECILLSPIQWTSNPKMLYYGQKNTKYLVQILKIFTRLPWLPLNETWPMSFS